MREAIIEQWERIIEAEISEFIDSIPERIEAVIEANGSYTRW